MAPDTVRCPLCDSNSCDKLAVIPDVEMLTSNTLFTYLNCKVCDCIFIFPVPTEKLTEIYPDNYYSAGVVDGNYKDISNVLNSIKKWLDIRILKKNLERISGQRLSVLDVGGGTGWTLDLAKSADPRIAVTVVVDLNKRSQAVAEKKGHRFHCQTIESFLTKEKFDFIILLNLIEHVADPKAVLQSMERLLSPGGRILVKTPNTKTIDRYIFQHRYWGGYHCPRHWVIFNKGNFESLATHCNLSVDYFSYTQGAPQWVASILGSWALANPDREKQEMDKQPLAHLLLAIFAIFDSIRALFSPTAQMFFVLKKKL